MKNMSDWATDWRCYLSAWKNCGVECGGCYVYAPWFRSLIGIFAPYSFAWAGLIWGCYISSIILISPRQKWVYFPVIMCGGMMAFNWNVDPIIMLLALGIYHTKDTYYSPILFGIAMFKPAVIILLVPMMAVWKGQKWKYATVVGIFIMIQWAPFVIFLYQHGKLLQFGGNMAYGVSGIGYWYILGIQYPWQWYIWEEVISSFIQIEKKCYGRVFWKHFLTLA